MSPSPELSGDAAGEAFCYLTTHGRVSGQPHEIEIWFATDDRRTLYLMAGGRERADWVRNLIADQLVTVRVGSVQFSAQARVVEPDTDEDARARALLLAKYDRTGELASWGASALPVAIHLAGEPIR